MLLLPVVSACAAEMVYTDGAVDISGLRSGGKLIQVSYDENGMLKGVKLLEAVNGTNALEAVSNGDRFYLWDGVSELKPLSTPITVTDVNKDSEKSTDLETDDINSETGFNLTKGTVMLRPKQGLRIMMMCGTGYCSSQNRILPEISQ